MSKSTNRSKPVVYDSGPTDAQIRFLEGISNDDLTVTDLSDPKVIQLLLHNQRVSLSEIKVAQGEISNLRAENDQLRSDRENLRIQLVANESKSNVYWLEIPVSILSGFAINMLTTDFKDAIGWLFLIMSFVMLIPFRGQQLLSMLPKWRKVKEQADA